MREDPEQLGGFRVPADQPEDAAVTSPKVRLCVRPSSCDVVSVGLCPGFDEEHDVVAEDEAEGARRDDEAHGHEACAMSR